MVPFTTERNLQSSTLIIPSVSPSFHGTIFTCEVTIRLPQGNTMHRNRDFILVTEVISKILLKLYYKNF